MLLRAVAATVDQVAASVDHAYSQHAGELRIGAVSGWDCALAGEAAAQRWAAFMQGLAGSVRQVSGDLAATAEQYRSTDEAAAVRIVRAGQPR